MNTFVNFLFKLLVPAVLIWLTIVGLIEAGGQ